MAESDGRIAPAAACAQSERFVGRRSGNRPDTAYEGRHELGLESDLQSARSSTSGHWTSIEQLQAETNDAGLEILHQLTAEQEYIH